MPKLTRQGHVEREERPIISEKRLNKRKARKICVQVRDLDMKFYFVKFLAVQNVHSYPYIRDKYRFG